MFELVLPFVIGAVTAGVIVLKLVAPRTKTKVDDQVLEILKRIETLLPHDETVKTEVKKVRDLMRDHRGTPR